MNRSFKCTLNMRCISNDKLSQILELKEDVVNVTEISVVIFTMQYKFL